MKFKNQSRLGSFVIVGALISLPDDSRVLQPSTAIDFPNNDPELSRKG